MIQLDIGCGNILRKLPDVQEIFGCDIIISDNPNIKQADLSLDSIPFENDSFDVVTAYDFVEHIPPVMYINGKKRNCVIELFNEVYRVLKDNGLFLLYIPVYPNITCFQDPTHSFIWTLESKNYFSGDYYGFHDHYGHTSNFVCISQTEDDIGHVTVKFKAYK